MSATQSDVSKYHSRTNLVGTELRWSLSQASLSFSRQSELMTHMKYLQTKQLDNDILQKNQWIIHLQSSEKLFFILLLYRDAGGDASIRSSVPVV